jgi:mono/diheme cytochrome c family protein
MARSIRSARLLSCASRSIDDDPRALPRLKGKALMAETTPTVRRHLPSMAFVLATLIVIAGVAGAFIYTGVYNIGADAPHSKTVTLVLDQLRERAIAQYSRNIVPPADLGSAKRIAMGAGMYGEMCSGCHLGPGIEKSEISQGLYPAAPELARGSAHSAAERYWIIKHGIKLSAMPAWGQTHDDALIWDMVAFLQTLPNLSPEQYQAALASAPEDHDEMMENMPAMAGTGTQKPGGVASKVPPHGAPGHHH